MDLRALDVPIQCRFRPMGAEVPVALLLTLIAPADHERGDHIGELVLDSRLMVRFPGWEVTLLANVYGEGILRFAGELATFQATLEGTPTLEDRDGASSLCFGRDGERDDTVRVYVKYYQGITEMDDDPHDAELFDGPWAIVVGIRGLVVDRAALSDIVTCLREHERVRSWRRATDADVPATAGWEQQPLD